MKLFQQPSEFRTCATGIVKAVDNVGDQAADGEEITNGKAEGYLEGNMI